MRTQPQQVIQDTGNLVKHDTDVLCTQRRLDTEQFFDRQHIAVLVAHHGHVIEPVHVTDTLVIRLALGQFFGAAMQQTDMRVGALDHLAVHFQHQAQHAVCGRMLRPEVQGEITNFRHVLLRLFPGCRFICCLDRLREVDGINRSGRITFGTSTRGSMLTG